jgi:hypothetical protein
MQIGEAKVSALLVAGLTGVLLTLTLYGALRSLATALSISVPVTLILGVGMFLAASDEIKKQGGDTPQKDK